MPATCDVCGLHQGIQTPSSSSATSENQQTGGFQVLVCCSATARCSGLIRPGEEVPSRPRRPERKREVGSSCPPHRYLLPPGW